jgi:hypothetical protein
LKEKTQNLLKKTIKHCQDKLEKDEYILVLDDDDMEKLASLKKDEGNEAVDEYMDNKLDVVID